MIDKDEVQEILKKSLLDKANVDIYLFENKKLKENTVFIYNLNIEQKIVNLVKQISKNYLSSITKLLDYQSLDNIPLYNPDDEQVLFKIDSQQVEIFKELYDIITNPRLYGGYRQDNIDEKKIKAWIFRFEISDDNKIEQVLFFQRFQANKMLKSRGIPIYEQDKEFKLFEANIISFNHEMDLVYFKDTFIVVSRSSFEQIFGYEEYYRQCACKLIEDLDLGKIPECKINIEFENKDDVIAKIQENMFLARKFYTAQSNGYYKEMDFQKLSDLNTQYKFGLDLNQKENRWTIDSQIDLKIAANILNDEYELSKITPNEYIVSKKKKL